VERWSVKLPPGVRPPFEVYVNGVAQTEGVDYERRGGTLLFDRPLVKEGKVAWWRWLIGAFGVGTYRRDDQVDVRYELRGRPQVAHALDIEPPGEATRAGGRISEPRNLRNPRHRE
jgi:hypothetical protein